MLRKESFEVAIAADGDTALEDSTGVAPTSCCWT